MLDHKPPPANRALQPLLHNLVSTVHAPASALSSTDGQIRESGVQGVFFADNRVLSQAYLLVDGREPEPIAHHLNGPGAARFVALIRWAGDHTADPTVRLDRIRRVTATGTNEEIRISSTASTPVSLSVSIDLSCDFAPIEVVKSGGGQPLHPAVAESSESLVWQHGGVRIGVNAPDATLRAGENARLSWDIALAPHEYAELRWSATVTDTQAVVVTPAHPSDWTRPEVTTDDHRISRLLEQSLDDLQSLRLAEATSPGDTFLGAGVPWFLTLFGRDSIWAARMLLPLGTDLAAGTLRVLARRQGRGLDDRSGEAPGKIMHELRRHDTQFSGNGMHLPAAYYGTVDATLLWISLLHDAWRWGMPHDEIVDLLPNLEAALGWLDKHADPDGDGFVEYIDTNGHGLANQGWKDSGDSIRYSDGRQAESPIALVEVQGYAYQAAVHGAALLDAFGLAGAQRWRDYAGQLAERFRAAFWVDGPMGAHPALALDRFKRPVDSLTSNIGHLLGTGILSPAESARVAELLQAPAIADGFGLRTMSSADQGFSPLSYHCGTVWTHDTAIAITGLALEGHGVAAASLATGLLHAAETFDFRLPELHGGDSRHDISRPVPYPAACRPQAWSAAASIAIVHAMIGLQPDVPAGRIRLRPLAGAPLGAVTAHGLRVAGQPVSAAVDRTGAATITELPSGLTLERGDV